MDEVVSVGSDISPEMEEEWVKCAQRGDLRAFGALVEAHQASLRSFVALRISLRSEAEDLSQETFVIAWRKLADFEAGGYFGAWLRTIARHLILNHRRKFRAESVGSYQELENLWGERVQAQAPNEPDRLAALRDCLTKMDGPSLKLLRDRYLEGLTVHEIARQSGKGYSALTTRLYRLRELLAVCIENEMEMEASK